MEVENHLLAGMLHVHLCWRRVVTFPGRNLRRDEYCNGS